MLQIIEMSDSEKMVMYMKCTKKKLAEMLIECNRILETQLQVKNLNMLPAEDIESVIKILKHHAYGQDEMDECKWDPNNMKHLDAFAFDHAIMIKLLGGELENNDT